MREPQAKVTEERIISEHKYIDYITGILYVEINVFALSTSCSYRFNKVYTGVDAATKTLFSLFWKTF